MPSWPLRFQDANFAYTRVRCWSREEGLHLEWIPYGMPRLNPIFEKSVFFLYGIDPKTGKRVGPKGTGVLVGLPAQLARANLYDIHIYAVTCQHLAPRGASIIRINTKEGKSRFINTHHDDWQWMQNHDDIAALDITDKLDRATDTISHLQKDLFVTKKFLTETELGIGEDGFMLGLFADLPGKTRNLVASRSGNLSLLADDDTPIKQGNNIGRPSHIFDIRSRPGFSGSPVFIYRTPSGDLRDSVNYVPPPRVRTFTEMTKEDRVEAEAKWKIYTAEEAKNRFIRLLGLHTAQYRDTVTAYKIKKNKAREDDAVIRHGDKLQIPNNMTVIAPAWEILTLLEHPAFKEQRQQREEIMIAKKAKKKKNEPHPESIRALKDKPTTDIIDPGKDDTNVFPEEEP